MNKTVKGHLSLLIANLIYSANYTIAKEVMPVYITPFGFILLRVIGALVFYWIVSTAFVREKIDYKDIPLFIVLGLFGVAINQLLFFKGLNITTPINASIMMISTPLLVLIVSNRILKERITSQKLLGIGIGFAGAAILILGNSSMSLSSKGWLGDLYILVNALSWGVYLVLVKPLMQKYNTITIIKWVFLFGIVFVFPFGFNELSQVNWTIIPEKIWWCIAFVVFATTCIAYILNTYALKELNPSVVSGYIYLQPVLATFIAIASDKDELTWFKIVSALLIFAGVYLVSTKKKATTA